MNIGHYSFAITAACLIAGCAHSRIEDIEAGMPQLKPYEERYNEKWEKYRNRECPSPRNTPYDDNLGLRSMYLESYTIGVRTAIEKKGLVNVDFFPANRAERAHGDGFLAGREAVQSNIVEVIQREMDAEQEAWFTATTNYLKSKGIEGP